MSSVEKTPTVSPDQGATGETSTSIQLMEAGKSTKKDTETGKSEDVFHKRLLILLAVFASVSFVILTIRFIISITSTL